MTITMTSTISPSLAQRLKVLTRDTHEALDGSIMAAASFDSIESYIAFVEVQYLFHRDIKALYDNPPLQVLLPDLAGRRRLSEIAADLTDLDRSVPQASVPPVFAADAIDVPTALGWLYVAEGSKMGAALLRKEVAKLGLSDEHGARHLAPAPEGPAAHWRGFTAALDAVELSPEEEARVTDGARAAFARVQALVDARLG